MDMEITTDIIPNILLRLPSKDFVRSSCVCKLWRTIVADPSFRKLHVAHHAAAAASSDPEVLLVTETGEPGRSDEASVFNLSSAKAMSQVAIPRGYSLAGVCNGLLCFAFDHDQAPPIVCNPVTGETLKIPKPPPLPTTRDHQLSHLFVLGFTAPTTEYKMFRFSFPEWHGPREETNHIAVYTLGGGGGGGSWRQYSYLSRLHPVMSPAPVHINGNIFVATANERARAARMLVLDVATETHRSYRIPYSFDDYHKGWHREDDGGFDLLADGFDLNGNMCLVVNVGFYPLSARKKIQFWVMKPPGELLEAEGKEEEEEEEKLYWDLRYSFYYDDNFALSTPRAAWIDHTQTLCYRFGKSLVYKYDTTRGERYSPSSSSSSVDSSLLFDKRLDLPYPPRYHPSSSSIQFCRWSICGGYRPSLLSPLIFALPPSQDEKGKKRPQFEHTLLHALMVDLDEHMEMISEKSNKKKKLCEHVP